MSDFLDEIASLCWQTVIWEALISRDKYGKPAVFATPVSFTGRRVFKLQRVGVSGSGSGVGADVMSASQIWILGTPAIKYDDKVYISGDDTTRVPAVVNIERYPDETGELYVKVSLGSVN